MKKNKKFLALALGTVLSLSMLAGCGNSAEEAPAAEGEGTEAPAEEGNAEAPAAESSGSGSVYWLNFKPESDEVLQEIAATYKEQTGVEVKVVTAASGTYSQTLISEMDKSAPPHIVCYREPGGRKGLEGLCVGPDRHTDRQ